MPSLRVLGVDSKSPEYLHRLETSWNYLYTWLISCNFVFVRPLNASKADDVLREFVQYCYSVDAHISIAIHAVLAIQTRFPKFKGRLKNAWNAIRDWKGLLPLSMRTPLPPQLLPILVLTSFLNGFLLDVKASHLWIPLGVCIWTGFECLLRPNEICKLTHGDLKFPHDNLLAFAEFVVVRIKDPKNKMHFGRAQFALSKCSSLNLWLEWLCLNLPRRAKLFPSTQAVMSNKFKELLSQVGLNDLKLSLGSLRAGKATASFMAGESPDRIRFSGRWKSLATLEHYIQEAASVSVMMDLPAESTSLLRHLLQFQFILAQPPPLPWECYLKRTRQLKALASVNNVSSDRRAALEPTRSSQHLFGVSDEVCR